MSKTDLPAMDVLLDSPFASTPPEDMVAIREFPGFQIIRDYLHDDVNNISFCAHHTSTTAEAKQDYILHRDMLHAMIMPIVQLFCQASTLAFSVLRTRRPEDLELAFKGEARDVFVWLQSFITEEDDWCNTRGCPACIATHTLSTESTVRATIAAILLSTPDSPSTPTTSSSSSSSSSSDDTSPSLPDFSPILLAFARAVAADPFWGPSYYAHAHARAARLAAGIHTLIAQCAHLESEPVVAAPPQRLAGALNVGPREMALKKGNMARRQSRLKREEREVRMRLLLAAGSGRRAEWMRCGGRARSLTSP